MLKVLDYGTFKPLPRDPAYQVSARGKVRGVHGLLMREQVVKGGYRRVPLRDGKHYLVHRLVLETFVGPCPEGHEASHEDGNPENNWLSNLRWRPVSENNKLRVEHGTHFSRGRAILTEDDVATIRRRVDAGETVSDVARDYPVSRSTVSHAYHGRNWK